MALFLSFTGSGLAWSQETIDPGIHKKVVKAELDKPVIFYRQSVVYEFSGFTVEFMEMKESASGFNYTFKVTVAGAAKILKPGGLGIIDPVYFEAGNTLYSLQVLAVPLEDKPLFNTDFTVSALPFNFYQTARAIKAQTKAYPHFESFDPEQQPVKGRIYFCNNDKLREEGSYFYQIPKTYPRYFSYKPQREDLFLQIDIFPGDNKIMKQSLHPADMILADGSGIVINLLGEQNPQLDEIRAIVEKVVRDQIAVHAAIKK
jgi:hypothetical protein